MGYTIISNINKFMPSSRKRNKGKERKAKKAAEKEEAAIVELQQIWQGWVRGNMSGSSVSIQCNHGLVGGTR